MIWAVDCDNTINNLQEVVIDTFNKRYNKQYTLENFTHYNIEECLDRQEATNMKAIYSEPGIYDRVKPLHDAKNILQKLMRSGHEIYIVTHSIPSIFEEKCNWIKYHFPFIDDNHIVAMSHKHLLRCDIMVEDNLETLTAKPFYHRICIDYPWNRDTWDEVYGIYRVNSWKEIIEIGNKINKEESDII